MLKEDWDGRIITKFAATVSKTCGYRVQKDDYEMGNSELIKAKRSKIACI